MTICRAALASLTLVIVYSIFAFAVTGFVYASAQSAKPRLAVEKCGDANGDGAVDALDAVYLMRVSDGDIDENLYLHRVGDVSLDGELGHEDATQILRWLNSSESDSLSCGLFIQGRPVEQSVGKRVTVPITLHNGVDGFAGASLTISVDDPSVAVIEKVKMPRFPIHFINPELPADSIEISLVDTEQFVHDQFRKKKLFALKVRIIGEGETELKMRLTRIDSDTGQSLVSGTHLNSVGITGVP